MWGHGHHERIWKQHVNFKRWISTMTKIGIQLVLIRKELIRTRTSQTWLHGVQFRFWKSTWSTQSTQQHTQVSKGYEQSFAGSPKMGQIHKSCNTAGAWWKCPLQRQRLKRVLAWHVLRICTGNFRSNKEAPQEAFQVLVSCWAPWLAPTLAHS